MQSLVTIIFDDFFSLPAAVLVLACILMFIYRSRYGFALKRGPYVIYCVI